MKKFINDPDDIVSDALRGMAAAHPELRVDHQNKIIYRAGAPISGKVGLISGGGSGHEPLHGGFVGVGMLDAACVGEVFTSPVPDQILRATQGVDAGAGVLHIVKNYAGDRMNFEMATEFAAESVVEVMSVVIDDDVAVPNSLYTAGRRGVGVTVLVEKIAGAAAEQGRSLAEVANVAEKVNAGGRSMGVALTSCTVPAAGQPTFELLENDMEIGVGIHGEPGRQRVPLAPAKRVAEYLLEPILADLDFTGGEGVIVFANGMGGTPLIELYLMYHEVATILDRAGVRIARSLVGSYITSLEMAGCSVTLLRADDENQARETLDHLLTLAARGFDETPVRDGNEVIASPVHRESDNGVSTRRSPLPASPGIGVGPARRWEFAPVDVPDVRTDDPAEEWRRLREAIAAVHDDLHQVRGRVARELREADATIVDAHLLLLDDPALHDEVRSRVDGGQAAAPAWSAAVTRVAEELAAIPNPYLQARATDARGVRDKVLRVLLGATSSTPAPAGVLVSADRTPVDVAELDSARITAVLLAFGSPTAHSAILLRAKGIPAVVAAGPAVLDIADGTPVAVDGSRGEFVIDPPADVLEAFRARAAEQAQRARHARAQAASPAATSDGVSVLVGANIGAVEDARAAADLGADLAGLVRTEFLFLGRAQAPDVDEQEAATALSQSTSVGGGSPCAPSTSVGTSPWATSRCPPRPPRSSASAVSGCH